jgi:hypothetical protein
MLLLLYGDKRILNRDDLPVTVFKERLEESGFVVSRIGRTAAPLIRDNQIVKAGKRGKGGRYRLTNVGFATAGAKAWRSGRT